MKKKTVYYLIILLFCICQTGNAENYYVDSVIGDDLHDGSSPELAWKTFERINETILQPGDSVLFKSGSIWNGSLKPIGSGIPENPIVIDSYGAGAKPVFNGQGAPYVIQLYNQEYWEIKNLEMTNYNSADSVSYKRGVWIIGEDIGTLNHIYLMNLDIHHVNGNISPGDAAQSKNNGGIFFEITGEKTPTNFDDVLIDGCHIFDVGRTGISLRSSWDKRSLDNNINWFPSYNVRIRNNHFERISGNGLIWRVSHKPIVEYNVFFKCGLDLSGNAMFFFNCDSAIAQFNEAYATVYEPGETDASGFDADYRCKDTIYQYNYSHDNGMGAFVACICGTCGDAFQDGAVFRYNISQNEAREAFHLSGPLTNTKLYNNVIFIRQDNPSVKAIYHKNWGGYPDSTHYYNNIFFIQADSVVYDLGESTNNIFDYNVFYGPHPANEPADENKIISNPMFLKPGEGRVGIHTLSGYQVLPESPCIDSGKLIPNNGGKDFWQNPIQDTPDRGVHEFQKK